MAIVDQSKLLDIANTTVTVTTGASFAVFTGGGWHEPYLSLFVSTVGGTTDLDIEVSANGTNFVPAKDLLGNALTNISAVAFYQIPGKIRHIRANVVGIVSGTCLVQILKSR